MNDANDQSPMQYDGHWILKHGKLPLAWLLLPLLHNTHNTSFYTKNLPQQISKPEKTTQALSVYRKGTFHVYIKWLIVISWKVMIKKRGLEKRSYFGILV